MGIAFYRISKRNFFLMVSVYALIVAFYRFYFPKWTMPSIMYPIAFGTRWLTFVHRLTGFPFANPSFLCEVPILKPLTMLTSQYTEMYNGNVLKMSNRGSEPADKIVVWIAGGSFGSADPRNYLSFGQQILGSEPGADVYLIGCRAKPDAPNTYPHIHEHCSSVVYSIVSEVAPDRLISRKAAKKKEDFNADPSSPGLIMGADDTGAHLLLSIMQYINALYKRHVDISTLLLVSPITHLHHTNYPSTKAHKHPEPIFYFPYSAVINEWIQYLFGKQDDDLSRLLQTSNHIAANIRFNAPEYLTLIKSGHELVRKREFRQSFYFDPVAIRTFDRFIRDPYIGLVFNSSQFLSSITNVGKIEVVTVMHSAIRDDALIFSDFLGQVRLKNGDKVHLSNEEFHAAFTGCIRFSNLFNSCPDLVKHVAKVIRFS